MVNSVTTEVAEILGWRVKSLPKSRARYSFGEMNEWIAIPILLAALACVGCERSSDAPRETKSSPGLANSAGNAFNPYVSLGAPPGEASDAGHLRGAGMVFHPAGTPTKTMTAKSPTGN